MMSSEQLVLNYQMILLLSGPFERFLILVIAGMSGNGGFVGQVHGKAMIGSAWG